MPYNHLTYFERCDIQFLVQRGESCEAIARHLGRSGCTISRELGRNRNSNGNYAALKAQQRYLARQSSSGARPKLEDPALCAYVKEKLQEDWSPQTISEVLKIEHPDEPKMQVSHETIYQLVLADKDAGGTLYKHLRQGRKHRRKRCGGKGNRGRITGRVSIEERPAEVDAQERVGDWEGDTVIGRNHKRPMATFVDRKTLFLAAEFMPDKRALSLNDAAARAFASIPSVAMKTLTVDNGKEFASHQQLSRDLGVDVYFAHPYASYERGINENTNGLIRQYLPKGTDFTGVSQEQLKEVVERLNNRPRKKLGYRTPREVFQQLTGALLS